MQKQQWVEQAFPNAPVFPIFLSTPRWAYRRKSTLHARYRERWRFGLVKKNGREEEFIAIPDCPLHTDFLNAAYAQLANLPAELPLVYVSITGAALTLVLKEKRSEKTLGILLETKNRMTAIGIKSLWVNWNPSAGRRVYSSAHMELVYGEEWLMDQEIWHGPTGFRQQIPELEERAHRMASDYIGADFVVDLYSGLGLTLRNWKEGMGVELSGESVAAAQKNAPTKSCLRGKVEHRLPQLCELLKNKEFSVYTNPPRSGHAPEINQWLLESRPKKIVYLSCNVKSQARDLMAISELYLIERVQPLDFFPQTDHVESLALLRLR